MWHKKLIIFFFTIQLAACVTGELTTDREGNSGNDPNQADDGVRPRPDAGDNPDLRSFTDAAVDLVVETGQDATAEQTPVDDTQEAPTARAAERIDSIIGLAVTFDGSASTDPDGEIIEYRWEFGDGETGEGVVAEHTYSTAAVFPATLVVEDNDGLTDSTAIEVHISDSDNLPPTAVIGLPDEPILVDQEVDFDASASGDTDGSLVSYSWQFTHIDTSEITLEDGLLATMTFSVWGQYEARLEVMDNFGAFASDVVMFDVLAPPTASFTVSPADLEPGVALNVDASGSTDPDGSIVGYQWDFGDGTTETGVTASHAYLGEGVFSVELTVTDDDDLTATTTKDVGVGTGNLPPVAVAVGPAVAIVGSPASFNGADSYDTDGEVAHYSWDFGDDTPAASTASVDHTFTSAGSFDVVLTVMDNESSSDTALVEVEANTAPIAQISLYTLEPTSGAATEFRGADSYDPDGHDLVSYVWDFGDGGISSDINPSHTYVAGGSYTVELTVEDELGTSGTAELPISVGGGTANGQWRVLPYDAEESVSGTCNYYYDAVVNPVTCLMEEVGTSLTMDCGSGQIYTGTRTGDDITVSMVDYYVPIDGGWCGDLWISEDIVGVFVSSDRWVGESVDLTYDFWWSPFDSYCASCVFLPFEKTGTRL